MSVGQKWRKPFKICPDTTVEAVNPFGALPRLLLSLCALGTQRGKEVNNDARLKPTHFTPLIGCFDTDVNDGSSKVRFQGCLKTAEETQLSARSFLLGTP